MKKCVVLDLDNTLWGGIVGEDGIDNIALSLKPPGNSYMAFQQALKDLYDRGVLLAINSRNNPNDAMEVIRGHPNMILKEKHFAASRINWNDKASNLRELAQELNIGLDSMVFLDDDPTNRSLVRSMLPEVEVPDLPGDAARYASFLASLPYFPAEAITEEDKMRGNLYVTERLRKEEERLHETREDFLKSLGLQLVIEEDDQAAITRLSQMTEKTNQFNIDKHPLTEDEVRAYMESPHHRVFHGRLMDKFGDYGIVLFALVHIQGDVWHISAMLMSCRAFGRSIEHAFLGYIAREAKAAGARYLTIAFTESPKNTPAREFVQSVFGEKRLTVENAPKIPDWVQLNV